MKVKVSTLLILMLTIGVVGCSALTAKEPKQDKSPIDPRIELELAEAMNNTTASGNANSVSQESVSKDSVSDDVTLIERHEDSPIKDGCLTLEEFEEMQGDPSLEDSLTGFTSEELADMNTVNEKMQECTDSDEYNNADLEMRRSMAETILNSLEKEGLITDLYYDDKSYTFSFQYKCGVLGGWMVKDFDPLLN